MAAMTEIVVEALKPADEESLEEATVAAFARLIPLLSGNAQVPDTARVARVLGHPANTVLAARTLTDGRILGLLTLVAVELPTGTEARIEDVVVDESVRGLGLGRALVTAALEAAAAAGARYVDLTSAPHRVSARALYRAVGFQERETGVFRHPLDDYR
jgi:ribosomal protein S18 acetylase RimI-like enzyme